MNKLPDCQGKLPGWTKGFLTLALGLATVVPAHAFDQPRVFLGATSFLDGMPRGAGFSANQYFQFYRADRFNDGNGRSPQIPTSSGVARPTLATFTSLTEVTYMLDKPRFLGGHLGIGVMFPLIKVERHFGAFPLSANNDFVGDLRLGPVLEFDPIMKDGRALFAHRFQFDCIVPTGDYKPNYSPSLAFNPGSSVLAVNPSWAATFFPTERWSASLRFHYLWSEPNTSMPPPLPFFFLPTVKEIQAGQAVHFNFSTAYNVIEKRLDVGINGYCLKQLTPTEYDGRPVRNLEEQVFAIGPGIMGRLKNGTRLYANAYFETLVYNRPRGILVNLGIEHHF